MGTVNEPAIRTGELWVRIGKSGVVGECDLAGDAGELCMKEKMPDGLFLTKGNGGTFPLK